MQLKVYIRTTRPGRFKYTFINYYKGLSQLKLDRALLITDPPTTSFTSLSNIYIYIYF